VVLALRTRLGSVSPYLFYWLQGLLLLGGPDLKKTPSEGHFHSLTVSLTRGRQVEGQVDVHMDCFIDLHPAILLKPGLDEVAGLPGYSAWILGLDTSYR